MTFEDAPLLPKTILDDTVLKANDKKKTSSGWTSIAIVTVIFIIGIALELFIICTLASYTGDVIAVKSVDWWIITMIFHIPYFIILTYLLAGLIERIGYLILELFPLPIYSYELSNDELPTVCVQLAMFNEHFVSERIIEVRDSRINLL